jgi:Tfp pilus assembly protein PilW
MAIGTVEITLGKDVTITGVSNARSCTVTNSASDVDVTKFGDTSRKFRKALIEQTIELECVDAPGVTVGSTFSISGTQTGNATYICTSIAKSQPLDGIQTFTVSGSRTVSA